MFKNIIAALGLLAGIAVCGALLFMSYTLLQEDKTGSALVAASPVLGVALVASIRILKK